MGGVTSALHCTMSRGVAWSNSRCQGKAAPRPEWASGDLTRRGHLQGQFEVPVKVGTKPENGLVSVAADSFASITVGQVKEATGLEGLLNGTCVHLTGTIDLGTTPDATTLGELGLSEGTLNCVTFTFPKKWKVGARCIATHHSLC